MIPFNLSVSFSASELFQEGRHYDDYLVLFLTQTLRDETGNEQTGQTSKQLNGG